MVSLQQNEMFLLSEDKESMDEAVTSKNYSELSNYLYRVQKVSEKFYVFRHHLETQLDDSEEVRQSLRYISIRSFPSFFGLNPIKVKVNNLGEIIDYKRLTEILDENINPC